MIDTNSRCGRVAQTRRCGKSRFSRREWAGLTAGLLSFAKPFAYSVADERSTSPKKQSCTLGFSTYGMPSVATEEAIDTVAEIGFDSIELTVRSGWDADSAKLGKDRRSVLKARLNDSSLKLASLMEHVFPTNASQQEIALERLRLAAGVAHDLSPDAPPVLQTVLGGGDFDAIKTRLRDRLGKWVELADATETTIAIKPHRGGAVSQPADAIWLIDQLGDPKRLRMLYDYSHYAFRDMPLDQTVRDSLPYTSHIAVKDAVQDGKKIRFKLPGESGTIDFASIIRQFFEGGYRGDFNCEVSSMVSKQVGYDPVDAARRCYAAMSKAFDTAGVRRRVQER